MIAINILLTLATAVLLLGVIGEKDREKHRNITIAFTVVLLFTLCINMIK